MVFCCFSYEERSKALETIIHTLQEPTTFEDFCVQLCCPGLPLHPATSSNISGCRLSPADISVIWRISWNPTGSYFTPGSLDVGAANSSSGPPSSSGHVTFSSDNSYGFPASIFRHNSMQDSKNKGKHFDRSSILFEFLKKLFYFAEFVLGTVRSAAENSGSGDGDESSYASPKANKRLSFKHTSRKTSGYSGGTECWSTFHARWHSFRCCEQEFFLRKSSPSFVLVFLVFCYCNAVASLSSKVQAACGRAINFFLFILKRPSVHCDPPTDRIRLKEKPHHFTGLYW